MESIEQTMSKDHIVCDELFTDAENCVSSDDWDQALSCFSRFHDAMERHFRMEEDILFPRFEEITGMTSGPTAVMRTEHAQIRDLMFRMSDAIERRDQDDYLGYSETLLIIMQQHNAKEEQILYPMADQSLGQSVDDVINAMRQIS